MGHVWRLLTVCGLLLLSTSALAAPAQQMEGFAGEIGVPYQVGDSQKWQFTLDAVEYSIAPITAGEFTMECGRLEKLLKLTFTVQNPSSDRDQRLNHTIFTFTAVDPKNINHEDSSVWADAQTGQLLDITLKPAQKLQVYAVIVTDAAGPTPKLIVEPKSGKVIRYDLKGKAKGFEAPFADPNDPTGESVLADIPGELNQAYPLRSLACTVTNIRTMQGKFDRWAPKAGSQWVVATFRIQNKGGRPFRINHVVLETHVQVGTRKFMPLGALFFAESTDTASVIIQPEEIGDYEMYFEVPLTLKDATLHLGQAQDGHAYVFAIPSA